MSGRRKKEAACCISDVAAVSLSWEMRGDRNAVVLCQYTLKIGLSGSASIFDVSDRVNMVIVFT